MVSRYLYTIVISSVKIFFVYPDLFWTSIHTNIIIIIISITFEHFRNFNLLNILTQKLCAFILRSSDCNLHELSSDGLLSQISKRRYFYRLDLIMYLDIVYTGIARSRRATPVAKHEDSGEFHLLNTINDLYNHFQRYRRLGSDKCQWKL